MNRFAISLCAGFLLVGAALAETTVELVSEPGDYVGQGAAYSYDDTNADIRFSRNFDNGINMSIQRLPGETSGDWWYMSMAAPGDAEITVGSYDGATRFPFHDFDDPGFSFSGNGRGCNTSTGSFDVYTVEYDQDGNVTALAASFEQFCGNSSFPLRGEIVFNTVLPIGVKSIGVGLTRVHCRNRTTGQAVVDRAPISEIGDCRALGLDVNPGDEIRITLIGVAED